MNEKLDKTMGVMVTTVGAKNYALQITAENRHVDTYSWGYPRALGNHTDVVFYDLTIGELLQLGQSIMAEAGRLIVEREEK